MLAARLLAQIVRFDERSRRPDHARMTARSRTPSPPTLATLADQVLRAYPAIYLACHVEHVRRRSTAAALSSHDASILAHIADGDLPDAASLARHIGVTPSSLSATLKHLEQGGYMASAPRAEDKRKRKLTVTPKGRLALRATSVLDASRVKKLLGNMDEAERSQAVAGLRLLAQAANGMERKPVFPRNRKDTA
jgi:MarR family transcriptional regulator, organic hydroperoxide resistance regulator